MPKHVAENVIINTCIVFYSICAFYWCFKDTFFKDARNVKIQGVLYKIFYYTSIYLQL